MLDRNILPSNCTVDKNFVWDVIKLMGDKYKSWNCFKTIDGAWGTKAINSLH